MVEDLTDVQLPEGSLPARVIQIAQDEHPGMRLAAALTGRLYDLGVIQVALSEVIDALHVDKHLEDGPVGEAVVRIADTAATAWQRVTLARAQTRIEITRLTGLAASTPASAAGADASRAGELA